MEREAREGHITTFLGNPAWSWEWQDDAACNDADPLDRMVFTSPPSVGNDRVATGAAGVADKYCVQCPVRRQCLEWAKKDMYFIGVAGGAAFSGLPNKRTMRMLREMNG